MDLPLCVTVRAIFTPLDEGLFYIFYSFSKIRFLYIIQYFHSQLQPLSLIFLNFLKNLTKVTKPMHKGVMSFEEIPFRLSFLLNNVYFECMGRGLKRCSLASENGQKHHRHVKL